MVQKLSPGEYRMFHWVLYIPGGCLGFRNHQPYVIPNGGGWKMMVLFKWVKIAGSIMLVGYYTHIEGNQHGSFSTLKFPFPLFFGDCRNLNSRYFFVSFKECNKISETAAMVHFVHQMVDGMHCKTNVLRKQKQPWILDESKAHTTSLQNYYLRIQIYEVMIPKR